MKKISIILLSVITTIFFIVGCDTIQQSNKKQRGTVIGTAGGAAAGAAIGSQVGDGNTALGAIIGAVVGGATGAYIGDRMDRQAEEIEQEVPGAEVTRVGEGINVTFDETSGVYFELEKHDINASSAATLNKLANILNDYPKTEILVEGHTDSSGPASYNYNLSEKRAKSVSSFLMSKGISSSRISTKWYGETQPKYDNNTKEGMAKNRRVELAIIASEELKKEAAANAE
ncbi:outer membrane protein OmpA-like peptidoglycan-associated protein [Balneicella halophila]|uniref:Outer membrane protein OmpA-like peptidoglycan-associated protein n=1 Tax=Balneicella halophila TaxID=1537566 RepID=A0A7L4UQL5_BALHA|nr:OmpA family protein [Balneicella halophila]PVX52068.1 outer membrane protein OmpA-like peptidoglycan-associated protein [Balneicella halophila]